MSTGEFDLIQRIRARAATRGDVVLGIGDDAALLQPQAGCELVVTADTLNVGVHFLEDAAPEDIGWKSLAVNLSDLAAMGASPAWCTLALALPESNPAWMDGFIGGFLELAAVAGIALVGGDTTRGPLSISVTAMGQAPAGRAIRRSGAQAGDDLWVTGTPGDACSALHAIWAGVVPDPALRRRMTRPTPRNAAGLALVGLAHSCVDISDGLLGDLAHICKASGVGAEVMLEQLPASRALARFAPQVRWPWQASGGDDYELCFSAPPSQRAAVEQAMAAVDTQVTLIGRIVEGGAVRALDAAGQPWSSGRPGFDHFA
ncbi:MAG: thiamine-phosphate kinase [Pseudoxanthomonas sp.]